MKPRVHEVTLSLGAGELRRYNTGGAERVVVMACDSEFRIQDPDGRGVTVNIGSQLIQAMDEIVLTSTAAQTVRIVLCYGGAYLEEKRFAINSLTFNVSETPPDTLTAAAELTLTAAAAVQVLAANASRKVCILQAHPDNSLAAVVRVGGTDVDSTHGLILEPGQIVSFAYSGVVKAYADTADQKIIAMEEGVA